MSNVCNCRYWFYSENKQELDKLLTILEENAMFSKNESSIVGRLETLGENFSCKEDTAPGKYHIFDPISDLTDKSGKKYFYLSVYVDSSWNPTPLLFIKVLEKSSLDIKFLFDGITLEENDIFAYDPEHLIYGDRAYYIQTFIDGSNFEKSIDLALSYFKSYDQVISEQQLRQFCRKTKIDEKIIPSLDLYGTTMQLQNIEVQLFGFPVTEDIEEFI